MALASLSFRTHAPVVPQTSSTPATHPDAAAQIDELIKQANEQLNVKGQFQLAEEFARRAVDLGQKVGDKGRTSLAMVYLAAAYGYQGRLVEALEVAQKNLALARDIGNTRGLEDALNTVASVLGESGRYEESLGYFYECLELARKHNDAMMQYTSLLNIGEAYVRSGDPDRAEAPLQESLRAARSLTQSSTTSNPAKKGIEMALLNLGSMEMARQNYLAALNYYEQVSASRPESPLWLIAAIGGMAEVREQLGEPQKAIALIREAMSLSEKAATGLQYARLVSRLGANQERLGQLDDALASQSQALALIQAAGGNPDAEWQIDARIGYVQRARGRSDEALAHYRRSIDGIEHLRTVALNTEEGHAGAVAKGREAYAETADLLFELRRPADALAIAERGRARAFLDMLAESRVGLIDALTPEQHAREAAILTRISTLRARGAELDAAERDLDALHAEVRRGNPRYASVRYPEPANLDQIQRELLDDRTVLVEYLLGDRRSLAWVVTKRDLAAIALSPRKDIEAAVASYRKLLNQPVSSLTLRQSLTEIRQSGARLYRSVFQPIESAVGAARRLIIVPDGGLDYLPFEALVTGAKRTSSGELQLSYLAEKVSVSYGPSASALLAVQTMNRPAAEAAKALLAFGDPSAASQVPSPSRSAIEDYTERGFSLGRLPYARAEVLAIGRLFSASQRQLYLGADAREETVKRERLDQFRFIHFASHGFLDETRPGRSGLLLSRAPRSTEDGILQLGEIMRLKLDADLVTLSACSTGLGKLVNGEGILGLTRAIFYAGARNVAVSLWNVNDSATATLMASFYRHMKQGLPQHEAIRRAKLTLLLGPQRTWQHPYFWAAFVIQGEGR